MRRRNAQFGFSLLEVLVVIGIIIILATIVVGVGKRFVQQSQERLTDSAIDVIQAAIEQYRDFHEKFPDSYNPPERMEKEVGPDFDQGDLGAALGGTIALLPPIDEDYASSELLYYKLDQYPNSRRLIEAMVSELKTFKDDQGRERKIVLNSSGEEKPLVRFVDVWGNSLKYVYTQDMTFPLVLSAGIDGEFGTADDLTGEK